VAQTELDKTQLKASREGILGDKDAEIGEFVNPQRKIATLVAIKNVVVEVGIIEKQIDKVYPGQKIIVTVDAYPGQVFDGKIETISPLISSDGSKTFSIRAKIPNPNNLLLPGMFARAKIITYEADDAISVPNDALVKTSGGFQVFVVNKDNVAEARDVGVGYVATEFTQVESGLSPGEVVVVQKPPELKAGTKVKIIEVQK
jgi:membrane fusion protein (multidrug efflux system)